MSAVAGFSNLLCVARISHAVHLQNKLPPVCLFDSYGWLSKFLFPGTADAEKAMVPPSDEKENKGFTL